MSYRISLGKYIDSTALIALPTLTWNEDRTPDTWLFKISHALRISVHLASGSVMSTELEVSIEKKR